MEDDNLPHTLNTFNKTTNLTLEEFEKQLPRKMTIHLLSNTPEECKKFIKICTNIDIKGEDKLEKIEKKINLFSFMNIKFMMMHLSL